MNKRQLKRFFLVACLCLPGIYCAAQKNYAECVKLAEQARSESRKDYAAALKYYRMAQAFDDSKREEIDIKIDEVLAAITKQGEEAKRLLKLAELLKQQATIARKYAEVYRNYADQALRDADSLRKVADYQTTLAIEYREKADSATAETKKALQLAQNIIDAFYFYEDQYALAFKNGKYGFIDKDGNTRIRYLYDEALPFEERTGLAHVIRDNQEFLLDTSGYEYPLARDLFSLNDKTEALDLRGKGFASIPRHVFQYPQLKILWISGNEISNIKNLLSQPQRLPNLQQLDMSHNKLKEIDLPKSYVLPDKLEVLDLSFNQLDSIPEWVTDLPRLRSLDLHFNRIWQLPRSIGKLQNLVFLNLGFNKLELLPDGVFFLKNLKELNVANNGLVQLHFLIGQLKNLQRLDLNLNRLHNSTWPESIERLDYLQSLDLSFNQLSSFPAGLSGLKQLEFLNLSGNQINNLDSELSSLTNLRELYLSGNQLNALPEAMTGLDKLQTLYLRHNRLVALPEWLKNLRSLSSIYVVPNEIPNIPEVLQELVKEQ